MSIFQGFHTLPGYSAELPDVEVTISMASAEDAALKAECQTSDRGIFLRRSLPQQ